MAVLAMHASLVAHFVLALGVDGIGSPEDHEAFLGIRKVIPILARHASFLGHRLLALSFFWSTGLSQKALEEFVVLVEVLDGVGVVGAWALHELIEVVQEALLGLLAHMISHGDQRGVSRSATIFLILFALLRGGALILVHAHGLAFVLAFVEDRSDRFLTRGVVSGDVEQVAGGMGLQASKLVD